MLANTLGYIVEIGPQQLAADTAHYYRQGDMIGISGLEKSYEEVLRGHLGIQYKVSDAKGIARGSFRERTLDRPYIPGQDLRTTLDAALQLYGSSLWKISEGVL